MNEIKYSNVISIVEEIKTDGHSPLKIIDDEYQVYFIKSGRGNLPAIDLINEFFCHFLLKCWNIPTPDIAAIKLDGELLNERDFSTLYHKKSYYNNLTFGSKLLPDSFEFNYFVQVNGRVDYRRYLNPDILVKIGLFDIWVENTDRKPTNFNILIQDNKGKLKIHAMDHAFTFNHMRYNDLNPNPSFITNTYNDNILYSTAVKEVITFLSHDQFANELKEYFYFCIANCEQNFNNYVQLLPDELGLDEELATYLRLFLFNEDRNKAVFHEFLTRL